MKAQSLFTYQSSRIHRKPACMSFLIKNIVLSIHILFIHVLFLRLPSPSFTYVHMLGIVICSGDNGT